MSFSHQPAQVLVKRHFFRIHQNFISKFSLFEIFEIIQKYNTFIFFSNRNVISTWSSGTGGAGIIGALSYAGLISLGISPINTMLVMLSVPLLEGATFWILLRNPNTIPKNVKPIKTEKFHKISERQIHSDVEVVMKSYDDNGKKPVLSLGDKLRYVPSLFKYMIPISMVYLFEYFINQGLVRGFSKYCTLINLLIFFCFSFTLV